MRVSGKDFAKDGLFEAMAGWLEAKRVSVGNLLIICRNGKKPNNSKVRSFSVIIHQLPSASFVQRLANQEIDFVARGAKRAGPSAG